ncbi:DUF58 domain-containing protein [Amaricoccus sp.]|uniref:DUF58 domain-containing protein n=1 Tax=Amaricoccus sp. TaxID=1872485 RepID=UPI0026227238|nr:DUF58 domain-containing protein [Amaricoccus sp.]HRO13035.1 DUF58 domain-containing protein [Amaricoccus sp.]
MIEPRPPRGRDKPQGPVGLRRDAEKVAGALPPLLAQAEMLAATVAMGFHGRRRAGQGENFWQYRQAVPGDPRSAVDWRRSGKSDQQFIREMEWEAAQTVSIWVDDAQSMDYRGAEHSRARSKNERAALLALALAVLLVKAGERVALMGTDAGQPRAGRTQLNRMALALGTEWGDGAARPDYGLPPGDRMARGGRAVFFSDFLGDIDAMTPVLAHAADQGVRGCFVQVLDESEEEFPFDGRMIFESMGRSTEFETQRARALREAYRGRLEERRERIRALARHLGWRWYFHHTSEPPRPALLWLYMAVGERA